MSRGGPGSGRGRSCLITGDCPALETEQEPLLSCTELLRRQPGGEGGQLWLRCRFEGLSLRQVRSAIARSVDLQADQVSCAGPRDRRARVEQWFSVPEDQVEHPKALRNAGSQGRLRVLEVVADRRPVGPERVAGLSWELRILDAGAADGFARSRAIFDRLRRQGLPAWFPTQRFGPRGAWLERGLQLLQGGRQSGRRPDDGRALAAVQGRLFDAWLEARIADGLFDRLLPGDLLQTRCQVVESERGEEIVEDPAAQQGRMDAFEAVPLGPLFGVGMVPAAAEAAARETAVWQGAGLIRDAWASLRGGRRPMRFQPTAVRCDLDKTDVTVACRLPVEAGIDALLDELLAPRTRREGAWS